MSGHELDSSSCQPSGHDPINLIYDPMSNHIIMVKLQKQKSYKHKDHIIFKYRINIPTDLIKKLGWEDGNIELDIVIGKNKKLEISKAKIQK